MHVPSAYFNMVVYIYANADDAVSSNIGNGGGTGFLLGVDSGDEEKPYLYAVTNAHVLEFLETMGSTSCTIRINTQDGKTETVDAPLADWVKHPKGDDVAVFLLKPNDNWQYSYVLDEMLLREDYVRTDIFEEQRTMETVKIDEEDGGTERSWKEVNKIGIGTDTIMVGRFIKHGGTLKNYPVVRRGHIAMLPFEPVKQSGCEHEQEGFLVETYSVGGFSGSPVFVQTNVNHHKAANDGNSNSTAHHEGVFLLGIDWGHFDFDGEVVASDSQNTLKIPSGMMCVLPSWQLAELINTDAVINGRS